MANKSAAGKSRGVEPIVLAVAQVKAYVGTDVATVGSGFFYTAGGTTYYITNRHLVIQEVAGYRPSRISLAVHTDALNVRSNKEVFVDLYDASGHPAWREHSTLTSAVDVVAIPLTPDHLHGCVIVPLSRKNHVPDDVVLNMGQDLMVLGFPKGLGDQLHNLPIARNASLASAYPVPFNGKPLVLVDARLHAGTSGSPVLTKSMNLAQLTDGSMALSAGSAVYLVGIHSATFDVKVGDKEQSGDPLGLNYCWLASLLDDITS